MSQLVDTASGSKYTDQERLAAVREYSVYGKLAAVETSLSIPRATLHEWTKKEWWVNELEQLRSVNQDEHINRYHRLTEKALDKAEQGIDSLDGELTTADIKALTITAATSTDKARLLMNQPTSISAKSAGIEALAQQFAELSQQMRDKEVIQVVEVGSHSEPGAGAKSEE